MERGESSRSNHEMQYKYSRRAKSDIVIEEPNPNANAEQVCRRDCDQHMPIANVTRIMRRILPPNAKISDDAKETIQECVSEFISFITSEANSKCNEEFRKTVTPEDVLKAMATLGFDNYAEALTLFLNNHRAQDPDRGPVQPLQYVRRDPQQPTAQLFDPPSTLDMMPRPYVPLSPPTYNGANYQVFPIMNNYFMQGDGEGCSKDMEEFNTFK